MLKKSLLTMAAVVALSIGQASAETITKPHTFSSGTTIKSSEVNANFDTVYTQVNKVGAVVNADSTNNRLGMGTTSPETQIHIQSTQEAGIFLEADSGNSDAGEDKHPFIKLSQDGGAIKGIIGTVASGNLDPQNATYTGAKDNALLIGTSTVTGNNDGAVQVGTNDNVRMTVTGTGNVGIGTSDPVEELTIRKDQDNTTRLRIENYSLTDNASSSIALLTDVNGDKTFGLIMYAYRNNSTYGNDSLIMANGSMRLRSNNNFYLLPTNNVGIGTTSPTYPLHMASGAHVTSGGTWTDASSREYKDNIQDLTLDSAKATLDQLNPVTFVYKKEQDDQHVGFIAEDVPDLVATKDRKGLAPMDIVAVVTKVVQDQQKTIKSQNETIQAQSKEIQAQSKEIQAQSKEIQELKTMLQQTLAGLSAVQRQVNHLKADREEPVLNPVSYTETTH